MSVNERLARIEQKLDDMIGTQHSQLAEQRVICKTHNKWTNAIQSKVDEHEATMNRAEGVLKVAAVAAPIIGAGIWLKVKHIFGF